MREKAVVGPAQVGILLSFMASKYLFNQSQAKKYSFCICDDCSIYCCQDWFFCFSCSNCSGSCLWGDLPQHGGGDPKVEAAVKLDTPELCMRQNRAVSYGLGFPLSSKDEIHLHLRGPRVFKPDRPVDPSQEPTYRCPKRKKRPQKNQTGKMALVQHKVVLPTAHHSSYKFQVPEK